MSPYDHIRSALVQYAIYMQFTLALAGLNTLDTLIN